MKNTFGNAISMTIFGESHGPAIGAVLDGLAAGLPVDEAAIAAAMDRRRARGDGLSTARTEADVVEFLSGVSQGHTTGPAVTMVSSTPPTLSPSLPAARMASCMGASLLESSRAKWPGSGSGSNSPAELDSGASFMPAHSPIWV